MLSRKIIDTDAFVWIFGIRFLKGGYPAAKRLLAEGGLMVVPSAPSLVPIKSDDYYHHSLQASDFAIPDSSLMVLILRIFLRVNLRRISGLEFLKSYLHDHIQDIDANIFMIEPSADDHYANHKYLDSIGVIFEPANAYIAPMYVEKEIRDYKLLALIEARKPGIVLINLGGGIQERLGYFLKENLSYKPAIICTGAAIAFLSGRQVNIPVWADRLYLGWLFRCCSNPGRFVPRYFGGLKLIPMLLSCSVTRYGFY